MLEDFAMRQRSTMTALPLVCIGLLAAAAPALAYDLSWFTVDGGGAMFTTGGTYELSGTIGQADASGPMTGGTFSLVGGFWALPATVPCPGDGDGDADVDQDDLDLVLFNFGTPQPPGTNGDVDGDGDVDQDDLDLVLFNFGVSC